MTDDTFRGDAGLADAGLAIGELATLVEQDLKPLAEDTAKVFETLGQSIGDSLEDAASRGRLSVRGMVDDVLQDLARLAAQEFVRKPLEGVFEQVFGGARVGGGGVGAGVPYLVGERGPEMFVPASSGRIDPAPGGRPINVSVTMNGVSGASEVTARSSTQVAAVMQKALARAARNA